MFAEGLVGCEDWRRFVLLEAEGSGPVRLLQCLDDPEVGFLVTDPYDLIDGYELEMPEGAARAIDLGGWQDAMVLCTLVVQPEPLTVTANLLGPLVVNRNNGRAVQVVLCGSRYSTREVVACGPTGAGEC